MRDALEILFWACAGCVVYTYLLYPFLLAVLARFRPAAPLRGPFTGSVSVVVSALNEQATIERRLDELTGMIAAAGLAGEVVVVSDGSTDHTADLARAFPKGNVKVLDLAENVGKAAALSAGVAAAGYDIVVFADARQTWEPEALQYLLENFADPAVGAVGGDLVLESKPGVLAGVGLYWRYEKWIRRQESRVHSTVGVTGAIAAVRRELFAPIPKGTLLDDVYWPLCVAMQGARVVHDDRARAHDQLPARARDEFRRKVRTLSGNLQLAARLPAVLLPWCNPIWTQLVSHKLLRLVVPWALLLMLPASALLGGPVYNTLFWAQFWCYVLGVAGTYQPFAARVRPASSAASFLVLNAAAWCAFWLWVSGRAGRTWGKVAYGASRRGLPVPVEAKP
jgi:cellulose synthase/poly-beta-1,6-N-acetylglucosamine synthase-like glycosyltransferase